jgi:hypothetical protein
MSHLKFLTFQRNLCLKVKDKLFSNLKLNKDDLISVENCLHITNTTKDLIIPELNINIKQSTKQLENIQNEIRFLKEREKILKNNINFFTNLQKYL